MKEQKYHLYPTPTTIDTFYTDANGQLVTPEKLEYGKGYSLVEVQAPYGYVLDSTPVYFDVAEEHSSDEGGITVINILELIVETVCTKRPLIRIGAEERPAEIVRSRFMKLNAEHIRYVMDCFKENTTKIRNIRQYTEK